MEVVCSPKKYKRDVKTNAGCFYCTQFYLACHICHGKLDHHCSEPALRYLMAARVGGVEHLQHSAQVTAAIVTYPTSAADRGTAKRDTDASILAVSYGRGIVCVRSF